MCYKIKYAEIVQTKDINLIKKILDNKPEKSIKP